MAFGHEVSEDVGRSSPAGPRPAAQQRRLHVEPVARGVEHQQQCEQRRVGRVHRRQNAEQARP